MSGKSLDLVHLYKEGHFVYGIEGVPLAVEEMYKTANLEFTKKYCPEIDGFVYSTLDEKLKVFSCDFFKMKPELVEKLDAVFDRGAFEAIFESDRAQYVQLIMQMLKEDFRYILNVYEYEDAIFKGPPRACKKDEVLQLFNGHKFNGKETKATILSEEDFSQYGKDRWNIQDPNMKKFIYAIQAE